MNKHQLMRSAKYRVDETSPFKIKYFVSTTVTCCDKYFSDYSEALSEAGKFLDKYGNVKMEVLFIGHRSIEENKEAVIYRHFVFDAAK